MIRVLVAVVALVLAACDGPPFPYSFGIDPAFPRAETDDVLDAMAAWNEVTRPEYRTELEGDNWRIHYVAPGAECEANAWGCENSHRQAIWIKPGLGRQTFGVTMHEIGHAFGLEHVEGGVMDPHIYHDTLTPGDLAECRRVGACL